MFLDTGAITDHHKLCRIPPLPPPHTHHHHQQQHPPPPVSVQRNISKSRGDCWSSEGLRHIGEWWPRRGSAQLFLNVRRFLAGKHHLDCRSEETRTAAAFNPFSHGDLCFDSTANLPNGNRGPAFHCIALKLGFIRWRKCVSVVLLLNSVGCGSTRCSVMCCVFSSHTQTEHSSPLKPGLWLLS